MTSKRIQLTLFVAQNESSKMEQVRREFNPEQYGLIKAHVTLCREDELEQLERIVLNLRNLDLDGITVDLGSIVRFSDGKGVLIPAIGDNAAFQKLREKVLQGAIEAPRAHEPHITLIHPRNSTCTDEIFGQIEQCSFPSQVKFTKISLIEQEVGQEWKVLEEFELRHYQPHKPYNPHQLHQPTHTMQWTKRGQIFDPTSHNLDFDCTEFAVSPQTLVFDDFVRIYFSTRRPDPTNGKLLSHVAFVDMDRNFQIINHSRETVVPLGGLGCFDEHGIFPINVLRHDDKIWAYTTGWSRRASTSVDLSTGLAFSHDGGLTFEKYGTGPVLTSSLREPVLVGDSFVQVYDGVFHMWYIFGRKWRDPQDGEPPVRCYKIAHATSADGILWEKEEALEIISNVFGDEENQALPTVLKIGDRYHMYFCFRQSTDFRTNPARSYRLGYAYSDDLKTWTRDDEQGGMKFSESGWDSEMMCYPHIFEWHGKIYLLYNGNAFGKYGFGLAEYVPRDSVPAL